LAGIIQDEAYYNQHVKPYLDDNHVQHVGSVGSLERKQLLGKAAALLHPINFDEPFGLSVIEAMACGTPVIACNRGSMPELIQHGQNGFLISDCEEAIEHIARIKEIQRLDCRRTVEDHFTADRMVEQYLEVYTQILSPYPTRNPF
jgi:glycosyltransferase involved in cell wall biosynthesis